MATTKNLANKRGVMMILSPAKTLDLSPFTTSLSTEPSCDQVKTDIIANAMKSKTGEKLSSLLGLSAKLTKSVKKYWSEYELDSSTRDSDERKPAVYAFSGPAFKGLDVSTCSPEVLSYIQSYLRIIDPLYGTLRPLDLIQPYRLEMASKDILSKSEMEGHKTLASWWSESITKSLRKDLEDENDDDIFLINLASDEYAAAVNSSYLSKRIRYIKVVFQQDARVIAVHAKRARGLMVRYIAENSIEDLDTMKNFASEGYTFVPSRSKNDLLVFDRPKNWAEEGKRKANNHGSTGNKTKKKK